MKILEPGEPTKRPWSRVIVCTGRGNGFGGCGAKLLIEEGDLFFTTLSDETATQCDTICCHQCSRLTDLGNLPFTVTRHAGQHEWERTQKKRTRKR